MLKTPPLQTATATIDTLCGRLQSATLLEDRRAAILGLRSFAKQYPASVASGSLRELITTLRRDGLGEATSKDKDADANGAEEGGDVDTIRLVMETLLSLFNPDSNSPEAGDEIAFFMADEFSMRQDNISLLLNLLDPTSPYADYYSRLYSVQILTSICAARPERLQECVLNAPLGTSRVVGVLDDARDAVRNAGLLLLVDLTGGANEDLRKIVAFEDVFGKVFALIRMEGGLADAGIAGQDCLSLLANLIRGSASNQTMFRESGCVGHFAKLLQEVFPPEIPEARFIAESREKAGWGVLQLLRLFLARGENSTLQNQAAFFRAGTAQSLLDMSFHPGLPVPVRVAALKTAADLISNNSPIQEQFAALQIVLPSENDNASQPGSQAGSQTNGSRSNAASARNSARPSADKPRTYVIEALLDLTLDQPRSEASLRAAACALIQAYLAGHDRIRNHFLQRAIGGYEHGEEAANVLTALLQSGTDTLGVLFSSCIVQYLIADVFDAKKALAAVKEGNESEDEEVLTSVQALGSQLETAMQTGADERVIASYASTLTVLLWDFADGVNDLLAEGSGLVQALVASVSSAVTPPVTAGLAASLLGTVYEFSTKDSPIPRRTLAPLLTQKLGRGKYLDALLALRRDPVIRDFGVEESDGESDFLNETFVDLFQTEYPRLRKAIDKDPGVEVLPLTDVDAGVDRDVLDDLRQQIQTAKDALSQAQQNAQESAQQAENDRMSLQKESQSAKSELERLKKINEAMQKGHEEESTKMKAQHQREREGLNVEHSRAIANARQEADRQARQAREQQEQGFNGRVQDYERRLTELGNAHRSEQSGHNNAKQQLETIRKQISEITMREQGTARQLQELTSTHQDLERRHQKFQALSNQAASDLEEARKQLSDRDAELSSLKSQIAELNKTVKSKDQELSSSRESVSNLEKELEAAKAASEAKAAGDSEAAAKLEKLEALSKNLTAKVKELQDEAKAAQQAKEAAEKKIADSEKENAEAVKKAKQAQDAAEKKLAEGEKQSAENAEALKKAKQAQEAAEKRLAEGEKQISETTEALKKAKQAQEAAEKKLADSEKENAEALEKAKQAQEAAEKKLAEGQEQTTDTTEALKKAKQAQEAAEKQLAAGGQKKNDALEKAQQAQKAAEKKLADVEKQNSEALAKAKQAKEAAEKKLAEGEKQTAEALEKAKQAKEAAEKSVKEAEKKAKAAADKSLKEAEKKAQDAEKKAAEAEKKAKDAADKAKKAAADESASGNKKKGGAAHQVSKKEADEAAKAAEAAKKEVESTKKELEGAKTDLEAAKKEVDEAKKGAESAQAAEKEAREELENMMLIIEDIEKKRDEYKGKVREMGGEVSEDEDEDDEDEDDEDDDEEEGDVTLD